MAKLYLPFSHCELEAKLQQEMHGIGKGGRKHVEKVGS